MKTVEMSILDVTSGFLCQQVNCRKTMGAGLALQIKNKWPIVFERYMKFDPKLGDVDIIPIDSGKLWVVNVYGQDRPGTLSRKTNYGAVSKALFRLSNVYHIHRDAEDKSSPVYFPWGIGCGRGGGDWAVISEMIEFYLPDAIICKLP